MRRRGSMRAALVVAFAIAGTMHLTGALILWALLRRKPQQAVGEGNA
jgi:hypothetical protein